MTKKELARLVRVSRAFGSFGLHEGERGTWSFVCPVHREALARCGVGGMAHRFPVHHQPWEDVPTVSLITTALAAHLADADTNGQPCGDLRLAVQ